MKPEKHPEIDLAATPALIVLVVVIFLVILGQWLYSVSLNSRIADQNVTISHLQEKISVLNATNGPAFDEAMHGANDRVVSPYLLRLSSQGSTGGNETKVVADNATAYPGGYAIFRVSILNAGNASLIAMGVSFAPPSGSSDTAGVVQKDPPFSEIRDAGGHSPTSSHPLAPGSVAEVTTVIGGGFSVYPATGVEYGMAIRCAFSDGSSETILLQFTQL